MGDPVHPPWSSDEGGDLSGAGARTRLDRRAPPLAGSRLPLRAGRLPPRAGRVAATRTKTRAGCPRASTRAACLWCTAPATPRNVLGPRNSEDGTCFQHSTVERPLSNKEPIRLFNFRVDFQHSWSNYDGRSSFLTLEQLANNGCNIQDA